jgi:hypothetical protein
VASAVTMRLNGCGERVISENGDRAAARSGAVPVGADWEEPI